MAELCPSCNRPLPVANNGDALVKRMAAVGGDVYRAQSGGYFISYGGGEASRDAIDDALARGLIKPKWPGKSHEYWSVT